MAGFGLVLRWKCTRLLILLCRAHRTIELGEVHTGKLDASDLVGLTPWLHNSGLSFGAVSLSPMIPSFDLPALPMPSVPITAEPTLPEPDSTLWVDTDQPGECSDTLDDFGDVESPESASPSALGLSGKRARLASTDGSGEDESTVTMGNKRAAAMQARSACLEATGHRMLTPQATRMLREWMLCPEHYDHPYPDEKEKHVLAAKAGITTKQLMVWFTNARKRIWAPMRKRQVGVLSRLAIIVKSA